MVRWILPAIALLLMLLLLACGSNEQLRGKDVEATATPTSPLEPSALPTSFDPIAAVKTVEAGLTPLSPAGQTATVIMEATFAPQRTAFARQAEQANATITSVAKLR